MDIYLVGGAIRDRLLGLPVTEKDWVVVGSNEEQLLAQSYTRVGKDFPVFLHPQTKEEYALARTERKISKGHTGFTCDANENVTLEEDLMRRDLTINAIAESKTGELVDPYGGINDLHAGLLKHVSDAFSEDPLRILRLARFYAKLPTFTVADTTFTLMKTMVNRGDLDELAPERIYTEVEKTLTTAHPHRFFTLLNELGAGKQLWPELNTHNFELLNRTSNVTHDKPSQYGALFWRLDKEQTQLICARLKLSKQNSELALINSTYPKWHSVRESTTEEIIEFLYELDAFRRKDRFIRINTYFSLLSPLFDNQDDNQDVSQRWVDIFKCAAAVTAKQFLSQFRGPELGAAIKAEQVKSIARFI